MIAIIISLNETILKFAELRAKGITLTEYEMLVYEAICNFLKKKLTIRETNDTS